MQMHICFEAEKFKVESIGKQILPYAGQECCEYLAQDLPAQDDVDAHSILDFGLVRVRHVHHEVLGQLRGPGEVQLGLREPHKLVGVALKRGFE